jgi:hypothetical protein
MYWWGCGEPGTAGGDDFKNCTLDGRPTYWTPNTTVAYAKAAVRHVIAKYVTLTPFSHLRAGSAVFYIVNQFVGFDQL